jgi:hypothetical protein
MDYITAMEAVLNGASAMRPEWGGCAYIRKGDVGDMDALNYMTDDLIVRCCKETCMDCETSIYQATREDLLAEDWVTLI